MIQDNLDKSHQAIGDGRLGIIDIGSNSIRLVIYDQQKRSPVPIYNEKVMCALGKNLATTGVLSPEGVTMAKQALRRFLALGRNMEITSLYVMATAAVRDAKDGQEFTRYLEDTYDISIDVISGKKEAKLGAYGVCASMYRPQGITGDLGGGSLELVKVDDGQIEDHTSVLLGSLRMLDETKGDYVKLRKLIEKRFGELTWLQKQKAQNFYAIGGSFRALAKIHMAASDYPLHILHEYKVDAKSFLDFVRQISDMPVEKIDKLPGGISTKRSPMLPGAAMIFENIIQMTRPDNIVFSASGIREGYLYEMLSPHVRNQDGLLASCAEYSSKGGRSTAYANELFAWMSPLLEKESERDRRLRLAFCMLCDIALHIHPEYRALWAFERIKFSALTGLSHRERIKLALALYHRYQFKLKESWDSMDLLKDNDKLWAKLVGTAANLAYHLSGSIPGTLHNTSFQITSKKIDLKFSVNMQDLMGDAIRKRIEGVNEAFIALSNGKNPK
jgi:exopolyphosphatase / guanosine-5'-triphosphate,3'-diphosphate pyrophosphatase